MFGKTVCLPNCQVPSCRCEELIPTLTLLSPIVKWSKCNNSWDGFRCKYQLVQIAKTRERSVETNRNFILRKMDLKFQNPSFNILCKIAFWNKKTIISSWISSWSYGAGCPGKRAACFVEQPSKMINFFSKKISNRMELS